MCLCFFSNRHLYLFTTSFPPLPPISYYLPFRCFYSLAARGMDITLYSPGMLMLLGPIFLIPEVLGPMFFPWPLFVISEIFLVEKVNALYIFFFFCLLSFFNVPFLKSAFISFHYFYIPVFLYIFIYKNRCYYGVVEREAGIFFFFWSSLSFLSLSVYKYIHILRSLLPLLYYCAKRILRLYYLFLLFPLFFPSLPLIFYLFLHLLVLDIVSSSEKSFIFEGCWIDGVSMRSVVRKGDAFS